MKELLFVDCCIRGSYSRTTALARAFFGAIDETAYHVTRLDLMAQDLKPLVGEFLDSRQVLLAQGRLDHPRFRFAHQFAQADLVVVAAPFWDLTYPALLKLYIENVSVDGITFGCNAQGIYGKCRGEKLVFLTTRGGYYEGSPLEQGSRSLEALSQFFGFGSYACVAADGLDAEGADPHAILDEACARARDLAGTL